MKITDSALTKLKERTALSNAWGVRLSIKGGGVEDIHMS